MKPIIGVPAEDERALTRLLERLGGRGFKLVIIEVYTPVQRTAWMRWLDETVAPIDLTVRPVDLAYLVGRNVWADLTDTLGPPLPTNTVLALYGTEGDVGRSRADGGRGIFEQFNVQRDILTRDFPVFWVLFIHPEDARAARDRAPDFCDFVALWLDAPPLAATDGGRIEGATLRPAHDAPLFALDQLPAVYSALSAGNLAAARDALSVATLQAAAPPWALSLARSDILRREGALHKAAQAFEQATLEAPSDDPLVQGKLHLYAAVLHQARGEYPNARRAAETAQHLFGAQFGPDSLPALNAELQLANILRDQGDYPRAKALHERGLEVRTQALGPDHPETLSAQHNLAATLHAVGDLTGARRRYEEAFEARTRILGPEHPDTLTTLQNLAGTLKAQGDLQGARRLEEQALDARTRILGPEHPDTLSTLQNLAVTLKAQGDLPGARTRLEQAMDAMTRILGPKHPDTLRTMHNFALTHLQQGDLPTARSLLEQTLDARSRTLGPDHSETQTTRFCLLATLQQMEDPAAKAHRQALQPLVDADPDTLTADQRRNRDGLLTLGLTQGEPN